MKRKQLFLHCLILLSMIPASAGAQQWSGIIDPSRAVDWSQVGVFGGIPTTWPNCTTAACNTLFGGTVNDSSISAAISSAPNQSVVRLPAGTFTGISGFDITQNNVILRGQGADKTKLVFNGNTSSCAGLGGGVSSFVCIRGSFNWSGSIQNQATWTAGFSQGTAVITLSSTTNLAVGGMIILSQNVDSAGYPTSADILVCANGQSSPSYSGQCTTEGASQVGLGGQTAFYRVQAIAGNQVTLWPPLQAPNWRLSQSPLAWWPTTARTGVGIENMTLDGSAGTGARTIIELTNAIGNWVQGVRGIITAPTSDKGYHVHNYLAAQNTIRNNYFYGYRDTAQENYSITVCGGDLIENNIVEQYVGPIVVGQCPGANAPVVAYNYSVNGVGLNGIPGWTQGILWHQISDFMSLIEGNDQPKFNLDAIHGTHNFFTLFRNYLHGDPNQTSNSELLDIKTGSRFGNAVGNVLGCGTAATCPGGSFPYYDAYEADNSDSPTAIYGLGGSYTGNGNTVGPDTNVRRTFMQWGNYDSVTGTVRFVSSEVPSGITKFPNPVPASQTLPASFYLSAKPTWWGSAPWPATGPDVTTGNIAGMAGHTYKIPARVCYEGQALDPAYPGTAIRVFNASTCYGASGPTPIPPFIISAVVN